MFCLRASLCVALPATGKVGKLQGRAHTVRLSTSCRHGQKDGLRVWLDSRSGTCYNISCVPNLLNYPPTIIMTPTIINCLRSRQSVTLQTRFSSRYSTPFDNPSNVSFVTRGFGTATKAGSNSHMYAENGDSSCSHRLHVCTYGSSSRSTDLEGGFRIESYDVSPPLPIVVDYRSGDRLNGRLFAALSYPDRVCGVVLNMSHKETTCTSKLLAAMNQPFPALTSLELHCPVFEKLPSVATAIPYSADPTPPKSQVHRRCHRVLASTTVYNVPG